MSAPTSSTPTANPSTTTANPSTTTAKKKGGWGCGPMIIAALACCIIAGVLTFIIVKEYSCQGDTPAPAPAVDPWAAKCEAALPEGTRYTRTDPVSGGIIWADVAPLGPDRDFAAVVCLHDGDTEAVNVLVTGAVSCTADGVAVVCNGNKKILTAARIATYQYAPQQIGGGTTVQFVPLWTD